MGGITSKISPEIFDVEDLSPSKLNFFGTPKYRRIDDKSVDPRSATLEITRTPLYLLNSEKDSESTPVTSKVDKKTLSSGLMAVEFSEDESPQNMSIGSPSNMDLSPIERVPPPNQDNDEAEQLKSEKEALEELSRDLRKVNITQEVGDSPSTPRAKTDLKKKLFYTPDPAKSMCSPVNKDRTPLGLVNRNVVAQRAKTWRGPAEERAKLNCENTPPFTLPPFGSPCSAPAKRVFP